MCCPEPTKLKYEDKSCRSKVYSLKSLPISEFFCAGGHLLDFQELKPKQGNTLIFFCIMQKASIRGLVSLNYLSRIFFKTFSSPRSSFIAWD